jgi:hypothetical protein
MGASGSINYSVSSGSYYQAVSANPNMVKRGGNWYKKDTLNYEKPTITTTNTVTESLTVKYYQRVFDAGLSVYCYYTKTSIDATPSSGETSPNYTGAISDHSVVKILEIY